MTKKEKEEDRVESIIRGLLKLPENRRCINCNSLGPQYVCTTFSTFVCTNCSGVHREFTHRVKSVSMAKFNAEEVTALQAGGNERARQIYFKEWDPRRNSYPDGSNLHRLRDFIKYVYVDRKYSGHRNHDRMPSLRLSDKEEFYENRRVGFYSGRSRSPNYEDRYERRSRPGERSDERNLICYLDERRSPRYAQENSRYGGFKRTPIRFEVVDDRFRDDGIRSGKESDNRRFSHRESSFGSLPPDDRKNKDQSSSPFVRPVKDILGENSPSLQVGEHSKATDRKDADASAGSQMIASSSSKGSIEEKAVKDKNKISESLIDLSTHSMSSDAAAEPQTQENHSSRNEGDCNSSESSTKQAALPSPKPNTLEFLLYELSVPSAETAGSTSDLSNSENPPTASGGNMPMSGRGFSETVPVGLLLTLPGNNSASTNALAGNLPTNSPTVSLGQMLALPNIAGASATAPGGNTPTVNDSSVAPMGHLSTSSDTSAPKTTSGDSMLVGSTLPATHGEKTLSLLDSIDTTTPSATNLPVKPSNEGTLHAVPDIQDNSNFKFPNGQQSMQQHQLSVFPTADVISSGQQISPTVVEALNNQPRTSLEVPHAQGTSGVSGEPPSHEITKADHSNSEIKSQDSAEAKSSGRKELPADLFTASYSPVLGPIPGRQSAVPYGMGFNMQYYPNAMPMQPCTQQHQVKSSNPFDLNNDTGPMKVSAFPSMENLRVATPNVSAPAALSPTSGIDTNFSGVMATQVSPYASMPLQTSPYPSPASAGADMGQHLHVNTPSSGAQAGAGYGGDAFFGSGNMVQQSSSGYPLFSAPNSVPSLGGNPFR